MANKQHRADREAEQYMAIEARLSTRKRPAHILLISLCASLIVTLGLLLCLLPQKEFSPEENRTLSTVPALSLDVLLDGTWTADIADFCADQFPLRSWFVRAKAGIELLLGKQENNGVLLGKGGYLISRQEYTSDDQAVLESNLDAISRFSQALAQADIPFTFAVVPRSIDVNVNRLPALYDPCAAYAVQDWITTGADSQALSILNLTEELRSAALRGEAVWYKTDHHWTTLGAYYAYIALGKTLGYTPLERSTFVEEIVCDNFLGTTYTSSGMNWISGEPITLFRFENDNRLKTEILQNGQVSLSLDGLYDFSALQTHDEYNVFLGGTNTVIRVTDPTRENAPMLVLLKDSFSQSLAPFLARHYDLLLIDPRTYSTKNEAILSVIEQQNADAVLLLYGIDTLMDSYSLRILTYGLK